jgi:3',5'-cyclic AMP phosphodiesterase CpdA
MRILHFTDLHFDRPLRFADLLEAPKRLIGGINLHLLGRSRHFTAPPREAFRRAAVQLQPDLLVCTGDLTSLATDAEFQGVLDFLRPLLDRFPCVIQAGNHDTYAPESSPGARLRRWFGPWMPPDGVHRSPGLAIVQVETCRTHLLSSGSVSTGELQRTRLRLQSLASESQLCVLVAQHYPLRNRRGGPYGPATRALNGARSLEQLLQEFPQVAAVLHGHEHHGFRTILARPSEPLPILNPGAVGYSHLPHLSRTAHFNIYTVQAGALTSIERWAFDGAEFRPEPGGAYATAR